MVVDRRVTASRSMTGSGPADVNDWKFNGQGKATSTISKPTVYYLAQIRNNSLGVLYLINLQ